ncbi:phage portal protein [Micromonospora sp. NPDC047730]|uniref:phage portal protein n=1 Tax=Micromonospora sp. NPDC047730 TaxID=3364253 RepID=UPI003714779D
MPPRTRSRSASDLDPTVAAQVDALHAVIAARRAEVKRAEDYFRGKQRLRFASDKWREYNADRYADFADNWCAPVGNSPNERLRVDGFRLDDDPGTTGAEKELWKHWQANDLEAQSSQGFLHGIISKRSYVLVWGDEDDRPVVTWERADQVAVGYDPERPRRRVAALKTWEHDERELATLYRADLVWKLERSKSGGPWRLREGVSPNPMRNPLGEVPVVEVPNRPMLGGEPISDIAGTMAMQDAINLLWAYLFNAADFASMPARVVMGQEPPKIPILDENGQKIGEQPVDLKKLAQDRILWLTGDNSKIGQWDAAKLEVFTGTIEVAVTHIAAQTRTPPHYLVLGKGMVNVNADGMKAAEAGLVKKVEEMHLFLGPAVREVLRLIALVLNRKELAEKVRFGVVQWRDAENHSEAQLVDALTKLQTIGFPFAWLAERYGLSPAELGRVLKMKEREAELDPVGALSRLEGQRLAQGDAETAQPEAE